MAFIYCSRLRQHLAQLMWRKNLVVIYMGRMVYLNNPVLDTTVNNMKVELLGLQTILDVLRHQHHTSLIVKDKMKITVVIFSSALLPSKYLMTT